jgi:hypothetical protein
MGVSSPGAAVKAVLVVSGKRVVGVSTASTLEAQRSRKRGILIAGR